MCRIRGSCLAGTSSDGSRSKDDLHIFDLFRIASNRGCDLPPSKCNQEEYFNGFSKSFNSFAIDPIIWLDVIVQNPSKPKVVLKSSQNTTQVTQVTFHRDPVL